MKIIIFLAVMALLSAPLHSIGQESIGLMAGPGIGKTINQGSESAEGKTSFKPGYFFGIGYDRILCESFTFAIHARYSAMQTSLYQSVPQAERTFQLTVFDLPLQIKYRLGQSKINLVLGAGPAIGKLETFTYKWNISGMGGLVTDFRNWNVGLDANYLFRNISEGIFTDMNGNPLGESQKALYINLFAKYSFGF